MIQQDNDPADEWYALEDGSFPAVPRPGKTASPAVRGLLPLCVEDTEGFRRRADIVEAALLILSQSPTARAFAAVASAAEYRLAIDPPRIGGAGEAHEAEALGGADHARRRINLRGADDPFALALALAHELTHVSQIVEGGLPLEMRKLHPPAAIRQLMAMEGDARAYEFLIATELAFPRKGDPEDRLLFPQAVDAAAESIGVGMARRYIDGIRPRLPDVDLGEAMARIFKCLYASPSLRLHYEDTILHTLGALEEEQPGALQDEKLFAGGISSGELLEKLDSRGTPYAQRFAKYLGLDAPQMRAVSEQTQARLAAFEEIRRRNPAARADPRWAEGVPVYSSRPPAKPAVPKGPAS